MKRSKAFTLIELLVLIVIISIVITISTPRFSRTYKSLKTKSEAKKLSDYLKFTRNKAVQNQKTYKISQTESSVIEIVDFEDARFSRYRVDSSLTFDMEPDMVSFYPNGMMSSFIIILQDSVGNNYEISAEQNNSSITVIHTITEYSL